jgi:hypothetical protein
MRANDSSSISLDFSSFAGTGARYRTILVMTKMVAVRWRAVYGDLPRNGANPWAYVCF